MRWRTAPGERSRAGRLLHTLRIFAVLASLGLVVTGILYALSYMNTPAIVVEHPNGAISQYAAAHPGGPCNFPATRSGLWIEIPALDIDLPVVEGDGSDNIPHCEALHYPGTAEPGAFGNSYLYAHGLWGMFGGLLFAKTGQDVILQNYSTGTVEHMHISNIVGRVAYDDTSWIHYPSTTPLLTLQTCIGANWNTDRWIVQASP